MRDIFCTAMEEIALELIESVTPDQMERLEEESLIESIQDDIAEECSDKFAEYAQTWLKDHLPDEELGRELRELIEDAKTNFREEFTSELDFQYPEWAEQRKAYEEEKDIHISLAKKIGKKEEKKNYF